MSTTLAEIVSKIASQGKNPDVSFLKDNPEAQTMLLMALLSANSQNKNMNATTISPTTIEATSPTAPADNDKRKYDSFNSPTNTPSPTRDDSDAPRRVGRKPVTSEEEDSDNPKSKRKAQNRAAQRAFRERKENHVRILEDRVKELEELNSDKNSKLLAENEQLKEMIARLQNENAALLGSSVSFDYPLSAVSDDSHRPSKIIRSSGSGATNTSTLLSDASPVAYFDSLSSSMSCSSKSRSNTPETQAPPSTGNAPISIDDILGLDTSILPSNALLDHSELLGLNHGGKTDYSSQLDDILNQHRLTFATDPSQFDFFYPLEVTNNVPLGGDATNTNDFLTSPTTTATTTTTTTTTNTKEQEREGIPLPNLTQVWDKVSQHPRFDEFDLDVLCDEMKKKAVCTEQQHDEELEKMVNKYYPVE